MTIEEAVRLALEEDAYLIKHAIDGDEHGAAAYLSGAAYHYLKQTGSSVGSHEQRLTVAKAMLASEAKLRHNAITWTDES